MSVLARARLWSGALVMAAVLALIFVLPRFRFETNILALLPSPQDAGTEAALDRFGDLLGRNVLFLIAAPDFDSARKAATAFAAPLQASPEFSTVRLQVDTQWPQRAEQALAPYRTGLVSERMRGWLLAHDGAAILANAQAQLYTPAAFTRRSGVLDDPLDVFGDFLTQATPSTGHLSLRDSLLTVPMADGRQAVMVSAVLAHDAFSTSTQQAVVPALAQARAAATALGASVAGSGLILHAAAAAASAHREIDLFSSLQALAVIGALLLVFRSGRVLGLAGMTLVTGVLVALVACQLAFGQVHLLTLVFCSNLAGVAIDYAIYFCADQFRVPGRWRAQDALRAVGPAISLSFAAAALGYAMLGVAPFPGLRQMALFCCAGLTAAWLCVMAWFPVAVRPVDAQAAQRLAKRLQTWQAHIDRLRARVSPRLAGLAVLLLVLLAAGGLARLRLVDDVRALQPGDSELLQEERTVRETLVSVPEASLMLVRGASAEDVLQTEEQLTPKLDEAVRRGWLGAYSAVSRALPSQQRQQQDRALLAAQVNSPEGLLPGFLRSLGLDQAAINARLAALAQPAPLLSPELWLQTPAAEPFRLQWLGAVGRQHASVVLLYEVHNAAALASLADSVPGVRWVDRVAEISRILQQFRQRAQAMTALAAVLIAVLFAVIHGPRRALGLVWPPVAAAVCAYASLGWLGAEVSFFNAIGLLLVLGLSVEYALFLRLPDLRGPAGLLSILLAAGLAAFAFGLLACSSTPFIHSLGLTVAMGIFFGFSFALLAGTMAENRRVPAISES